MFNPTPAALCRGFEPDRPSQFTGPQTVDAGHYQVELDFANYTLDRSSAQKIDQWNVAPIDLRVGLTNRTEIDFIYEDYLNVRQREGSPNKAQTASGFGDLTLLFKYNFFGNDHGDIAFGIIPKLKIPTNTANLGNKSVEGGVILPLSIELPANFEAGLQTGVDVVRNAADTGYEAALTNIAYVGYSFLDKKFQVYGEFYSMVNAGHDSEVDAEVDSGVVHYIGKNMEVDAGCNFGVSRSAADFEPFAGFSVRF